MHNSLQQRILQSTDIVEVVQEHVSLARQGKEFVGLCPFHPDHRPSLRVSPKKQIFKCFACGAGGDVLKFVQMRERVEFREALAILARRAGLSMTSSDADRRADEQREQIRQAVAWARTHFRRNLENTAGGRAAHQYALSRGLTPETIDRHGLGYAADAWDDLLRAGQRAGLSDEVLRQAGLVTSNEAGKTYDRFRQRLMFPIADALGRPVAFGGRTLGDDPAKYLNSPETALFSKSRLLYALDLARDSIEQGREAIVVEGYLDAVLLHQHGFTNAVAALGTALSDAHVKLLKQRAERLVLCFDGDQAGARAADRAVEVSLLGGMDVRVAVLEAGLDPADCVVQRGAAGLQVALRAAVDALEFKWSLTRASFGEGSQRTRRAAIEALLEFVAGVMAAGGIDPLEQGLVIRRLSELLGVPAEMVHAMLGTFRKRVRRSESGPADAAETSAYGESIRGLPAGLVAAVETLFGLLLVDASCLAHLDDVFADATRASPVWVRLTALIQDVAAEQSRYTRADVIARCDDAEICDLVSRACARAADVTWAQDLFLTTRERLASELTVLRMNDLQQDLRQRGVTDDRGDRLFGDLLETARGQDFTLAAQTRLSTPSS